ncbi:OapA N-terminal domain-containing protein [Endozoicomonas sp. SCSIO W0465]
MRCLNAQLPWMHRRLLAIQSIVLFRE